MADEDRQDSPGRALIVGKWLLDLARLPQRLWGDIVEVARDRHARVAVAWFAFILLAMLGLGYMTIVNSGFGFFFHSCAAGFSQERMVVLLMLSPIAFALALSSAGELVHWMEARRRGYRYSLLPFLRLGGIGVGLLLAVFFLARC